jgi:hypothetical protein
MPSTAALLRRLTALARQFGPGTAHEKLALIDALGRRPLATPRQVRALHEVLCLWHAYPDDPEVFAAVGAQLDAFGRRRDVRRHKDALENSGIAGTDIVYPFGAPTAQWLTTSVPGATSVAWDRLDDAARLGRHLLLLARAAEVPGYDEPPIDDVRAWTRRLAGDSSDAAFIVGASAALEAGTLVRDTAYNELDLPIRVSAGTGTPRRSGARWERGATAFRTKAIDHARPHLPTEVWREPLAVRDVPPRDARRLIALAHEAMVTRERDLDAFASADPRDVRVIDWEDGLQFACIGVEPERRFLLEAVYGFLTLQNGVPIGYALASALFGSSEIAYNVFETFRGGEAAYVYARLLATARALFGSDTFAIFPYQLGHENDEGLQSGAWWFYYKLGFRPREASLGPIVARETGRVAARRGYRTPASTLKRLVAHPVFFSLGGQRDDVIGVMPIARVGLAVTGMLTARFGIDRTAADRVLTREAAARLGGGPAGWSTGERLLWRRWAPLVAVLPGIEGWSGRARAALGQAIRAKGGTRENDAVALLAAHGPLRQSIAALMADDPAR